MKTYHPYVSDDRKHNQVFVKAVLDEMLTTIEQLHEVIILESDNCAGKYKSA